MGGSEYIIIGLLVLELLTLLGAVLFIRARELALRDLRQDLQEQRVISRDLRRALIIAEKGQELKGLSDAEALYDFNERRDGTVSDDG